MICFHCGKEIGDERKELVGLDKPYINLYFHTPDCYELANIPDLNTYLALNVKKVYNYIEKDGKKGKK
jgi:hypothetical protein